MTGARLPATADAARLAFCAPQLRGQKTVTAIPIKRPSCSELAYAIALDAGRFVPADSVRRAAKRVEALHPDGTIDPDVAELMKRSFAAAGFLLPRRARSLRGAR
jgi:hypothetical protein